MKPKIYVIHGHGGSGLQMNRIHKTLIKNGFNSEIFTFPSYREDILETSKRLLLKIVQDKQQEVSFVTHSMGALVVRLLYLHAESTGSFPLINRTVMIAAPNQGTKVADFLFKSTILRKFFGSNIKYLTTSIQYGAKTLQVPDCEIGIIAGVTKNKYGYNPFLKGNNDGYLAPESCSLGVEKDFLLVHSSHWGLVHSKIPIDATIRFLQSGSFSI